MSFQKSLGDIPTQTVTGTARPTTHAAEAIGKVAEVAGNTVKDVQKNKLETSIQQSADVVTAISAAKQEKGAGLFGEAGEINTEGLSPDLQQQIARVQANAGEKFGRIANAVRQGATSENAAALETEAMVRKLVSQTPGFSQEIKQLARELIGFDPTGFALRKILNVDKPKSTKQTAQEKRFEEVQVMQDGLARAGINISTDTLLGNFALRDNLQLEQANNDAQLAVNTYSVRQWAQKSYIERGPDLNQVMMNVVQMTAAGGIKDNREYVNAVIQQRETDKTAFRQEVAGKGGIETAEATAIENQIDAMYEPLINSINNNKMGDILADKIDLIAKINQMWGKNATPRLTRIIDAYGPQIGGQLLTMMSSIADPKQFELIYQFDPALKELIQGGQMTQLGVADGVEDTVNAVVNGQPITEDNLKFRNMTETVVTQPGNAELRESYVKGLGRSGSPVRAVSLLSTKVPRVQATDGEVKFMKEQYEVHVGTPATEDIPGNLIDAIAREVMALNPEGVGGDLQVQPVNTITTRMQLMGLSSKATGQTKLTIPFDPTTQGTHLDFQTESMKRLQPFMDAVTVKGYAGDLGANKGTFANDILTRVNARIEKLTVADVSAPESIPEQSWFTDIFDPRLVMGWALPENAGKLGGEIEGPDGKLSLPKPSPSFESAATRSLVSEGGFSDDASDPGNWTGFGKGRGELKGTKFGISAASYPDVDIENLTKGEALAIYKRDYWDALSLDEFDPGTSFQVFDAAIHHGKSGATKILQRALGITADGVIGPKTKKAIMAANPRTLRLKIVTERLKQLEKSPNWDKFGKGWTNRLYDNLQEGAQK